MKKQKGISLTGVVVAILIVAVTGFVGWRLYNSITSSPDNDSDIKSKTSNLATYSSDKYGMKFNYPKEWGTAQVSDYQQVGKYFQISFSPDNKMYSIAGSFDSSKVPNAFTSTEISKALAGDKSKFLKYDSSSYSTFSSERNMGIDKNFNLYELNIYQIVNLPKVDATAVTIAFSVTSKNSCPGPALSNSSNDCMSQTLYDAVNKFAKSIQPN